MSTHTACGLLGRDHDLTRAEEHVETRGRQTAAVGALALASSALAAAGVGAALAVLAACAAVLLVLASMLASALAARRDRALELVAADRAGLPLPAVRRQVARLTGARHRAHMARSLESLRRTARMPVHRRPAAPPLWAPRVIRAADAELATLAGLLREGRLAPAALARAERLLSGPDSPLYGADERHLREELRRITFPG